MIEINHLEKTNFADGMMFNPEQIKINDLYYSQKNALLSRYGFGKGILVGYSDNLRVGIENGQLILYPGAVIDEVGNLIVISKKSIILKDLNASQFKDATTWCVYISFREDLADQKDVKGDSGQKHFYKIIENYKVELKEKLLNSEELFEIARVYINHTISSTLKEAINPYNPSDNEIDLRYSFKNYNARSVMKHHERMMISNILRQYADYLTELSFNKKCFTASIAATFANKLVTDIKLLSLSSSDLYELLSHLVYISTKIQDELHEIVNTGFWKNILRLQSLFAFSEICEVSYYDLLLNIDSSFFSKVLLHIGNASINDGHWDIAKDEESTEDNMSKDYMEVGSGSDCDIVVEGEDIETLHAKLYPYKDGYFIEDISKTSGVYINAERLESGVKRFIKHHDFTTLGKSGKVLNLTSIKV